jgi:ferredoxin, 2Fe-2S
MPKVIFIEHDGNTREVEAEVGTSVMAAATANLVAGIQADCGGGGICGTCHVYIDEKWQPILPPPGEQENDTLDVGVMNTQSNSRLTCQITVTPELDGLIVRLPKP